VTPPTVYLLHFSAPLAHARHYIGMSPTDADKRIERHANGTSDARLMQVIHDLGITFEVSKTWTFKTAKQAYVAERKLKAKKGAPRLCPICKGAA